MNTVQKTRPKVKVSRTARVLLPISRDGGSGVVRIMVRRGEKTTTNDYLIQRIGSDWGDGYQLDKIGGDETYNVHLSNDGHTCDCKGHLRWNRCKHADCIAALRERQLI